MKTMKFGRTALQVPVIGLGCMMITASFTRTLLGTDGEETITMDELAMKSGGFHYEIPCVIGKRVPRIYVSGETVVGTMTYEDGEYEGI